MDTTKTDTQIITPEGVTVNINITMNGNGDCSDYDQISDREKSILDVKRKWYRNNGITV